MRLTTYAYPWDLARRGVAPSLDALAGAGIEAVDVAAAYHPIDAVSPDGRLFSLPRGGVLFPARPDRYGRVQPRTAAPEVTAAWPETVQRAPALGLGVNAWTVTLFQPWIVDEHPDLARVLPSGDPVSAGVCAANEEVREYLAALSADIVEQFGVGVLRLEGISVPAHDYGWGRPRAFIRVPRLARELLAICFCPACCRRGTAAGIDVTRVQRAVIAAIQAELGATPRNGDLTTEVAGDAELVAFVVQHEQLAAEVARAVRAAVTGPRAPKLSTSLTTPFRTLLGDAQYDLLAAAAALVDDVSVAPQATDERTRRLRALAGGDPSTLELGMLLVPVVFDASATSSTPKPLDQLEAELEAATAAGIHELSIYGWGLLPDADYRQVVATVRRAIA
jgi:hypothetical protein